ncbi:MAG: thiamine phosphate synthase [Phycisphaerales bacterium]|nr:MAG: thiamine phosphate synthase [Phycisphaerales bacterium]
MTPDLLRIIDANFNRSREALRVMEEYARFVLDDKAATEQLKSLRHELTAAINTMAPVGQRLAARDTPGDVGTSLTVSAEQHRADALAVFDSAAARLAESLRALEEFGKVIDPQTAARLEACRYRSYELGRKLAFVGRRHRRLREARLYVLVTESLCRRDALETIEQVARAGADIVQLREKSLEDGELLRRAAKATTICRNHGALFIINDRPDIACLCKADGVHVGQDDLPVAAVRRIIGPEMLVGLSAHNLGQLEEAFRQQPDYVAVGPMFDSATKPQEHIAGPALLAQAATGTELPIIAIGGISAENVCQLQPCRPFCAAVCGAVISDPDPAAVVTRLLSVLPGRQAGGG